MTDTPEVEASTKTENGGVRATSVSVTLNAKPLGVDAFIKLEQTHEFVDLATDFEALQKRQDIAEILTEQALIRASGAGKRPRWGAGWGTGYRFTGSAGGCGCERCWCSRQRVAVGSRPVRRRQDGPLPVLICVLDGPDEG